MGTGGTRALIVDGTRPHPGFRYRGARPFASPQIGWAEQNPEDWWRACRSAVQKALAHAGCGRIKLRASDFPARCTARSCWTIRDKVVRPALIWCDVRTKNSARALTEKIGAAELIRLTCNPALPNFTLTKISVGTGKRAENWKHVGRSCCPRITFASGSPASGRLIWRTRQVH